MAFRDLTANYKKLRSYYVQPLFSDTKDDLEYTSHSVNSPLASNQDLENTSSYLESISGISWVGVMNDVRSDMGDIKRRMEQLKVLHVEHLTPRFGKDFFSEEQQIEIQTEEVKRLFQKSKKSIESIKVGEKVHSQEELMQKNLKTSLITELADLSKEFRKDQREYLQKMKMLKERRNELAPINDEDDMDPEERARIEELKQKMYDPGFTEDQVRELIENEEDILRRDKELREILKSILDLQDMFKEFSTMIIEQGTLLDRIDYNLEQTNIHVKKGVENLVVAEKVQKAGGVTLCIILLVVGIAIVGIIFAAKIVLNFAGLKII